MVNMKVKKFKVNFIHPSTSDRLKFQRHFLQHQNNNHFPLVKKKKLQKIHAVKGRIAERTNLPKKQGIK